VSPTEDARLRSEDREAPGTEKPEDAAGAQDGQDAPASAAEADQRTSARAEADDADPARRQRVGAEQGSEALLLDRSPAEDQESTYGLPGQPLTHHSPFYVGFTGAAGALVAFWLGRQVLSISSILILIVVAMFLAVGLNPSVEFFHRRGLKRAWAVLLVILLVLLGITGFVLAIVPVITDQVTAITDRAPAWFEQLRTNPTLEEIDERYGIIDRAQKALEGGGYADSLFGGVLGVGLAVLSAIANTFIVIVLTLYFLASLPAIKRFFYRFAPASRRERVTLLGDRILANVGGYVSGAFLVATAAGLSSLVFLFAAGLGEYAVALAVVVALLDVIPMIGATLGAVIVTAIGFATDPKIGLACVIFYVVYQQVENYVIYPRVMARSVDIPGSLIVVAALIGAALLGVVGALLAIPTAAAAQLLTKEIFLRRQDAR
jgi:predicted PurR-regulated permease PerM